MEEGGELISLPNPGKAGWGEAELVFVGEKNKMDGRIGSGGEVN